MNMNMNNMRFQKDAAEKFLLAACALAVVLFAALVVDSVVLAKSASDIAYPVKELGFCKNEQECFAYCDKPENISSCVAFAEKHDLMSKEDAAKAKAFVKAGNKGPGGCKGQAECKAYCDDSAHLKQCIAFAKANDLMNKDELAEAEKVAQALEQGATLPGGCRDRRSCDAYCEDTKNLGECLDFAEKAGVISSEELAEARQVQKALAAGVKLPGGCKNKNDCDAYCENVSNMDECLNFAVAAGFIPEDEAKEARRIMPLMKSGQMPGSCKSKEQCEAYCANPDNMEECVAFAEKAGFMTKEEVEMFRKTGGKGPGGCRGKEECEEFCNNSNNQETCFQFGMEHGLISEEQLEEMRDGVERMREGLDMAPPEVRECLESALGSSMIAKIESDSFMPNPQMGEAMRSCFEQVMRQEQMERMEQGDFKQMPQDMLQFEGPGGCSSEQECREYCSDPDNMEECRQFGRQERLSVPSQEESSENGEQETRQQIEQQTKQRIEQETRQRIEEETRQRIEQEIKARMGQPQ